MEMSNIKKYNWKNKQEFHIFCSTDEIIEKCIRRLEEDYVKSRSYIVIQISREIGENTIICLHKIHKKVERMNLIWKEDNSIVLKNKQYENWNCVVESQNLMYLVDFISFKLKND